MNRPTPLRVLVIDDERPALDELAFLLERDPRVGGVLTSDSATDALRVLQDLSVDAVFLDISMPGLSGLELAQVLARFRTPPPVVFVTAHEQHAVEAFDLNAVDYVLKPVREERLAEAVRRVVEGASSARAVEDDQVAVELGGVTRFISRADIRYVEAQGDYARLHTADGSHLLRTPLATWRSSGRPPGSSASTARCWSRCRTSRRCAPRPAAAPSSSAAPSSPSAAATPASSATSWSGATARAATGG